MPIAPYSLLKGELDITRPLANLMLSDAERLTLTTWAFRHKSTLRLATRARIVRRPRPKEFLRFLNEVHARVPREECVEIYPVLDNYATHKTPTVKRWFLRPHVYRLHFTPSSGPWLDQVERFIAQISERRIRRGVFCSVTALEPAIREYLEHHNASPKPFV